MKNRIEIEEKQGATFFVDEYVRPPVLISNRIQVRISYRWRLRVEDDWTYGHVTFVHEAEFRPDYTSPQPKREPSATQQLRLRNDRLFEEWEQLKTLGLQAVRDHFCSGSSGSLIPNEVRAKADPHTGKLNNHSAKF